MVAQAELSLLPARKRYYRITIYASEAGGALLIVLIGTAGVMPHSGPRQMVESWINIHLLFGLLLCGWVMIRYQRYVSRSPPMQPPDARRLSRHLARGVYCVLYGVIGLKQTIGFANSLWHGGAVDFSLFDESLRHSPDMAGFDFHDDFQLFLVSGLVPLVIVRVMAFRLWLRLIEEKPAARARGEQSPLPPEVPVRRFN